MKLRLEVKSGARIGTVFMLPDITEPHLNELPMVLEDEVIQFDFTASRVYRSALLELYQHCIPASIVSYPSDLPDSISFSWVPSASSYSTSSKLFWNYFGLAQINITLHDEKGDVADLISFQPLQVAATKSQADKVEQMFEYLASVSPEALHSVFSATRHSVGFDEGSISPNHTFERIEHALIVLNELLPTIFHNPLTRLVPEHVVKSVNGREELDDSSIGWLLENLSVLEPTDISDEAHISFEGENFRANSLLLSVLGETSDIYENWVVHGFVELLILAAQSLGNRMEAEMRRHANSNSAPSGYVSFFDKVTKFKKLLLGSQTRKIDTAISTLKQYKLLLDRSLPVNRSIHVRPIVTLKVFNKPAYRDLFCEVIKWHERGQVDWTAYQNLFAIESIPFLFESYTYFRVMDIVNRYLDKKSYECSIVNAKVLKNTFIDHLNNEIVVFREPNYWAIGHKNKNPDSIVNIEAYTVSDRGINQRGQRGSFSKRAPDIVIQIKGLDGIIKLIVLDAKYSYADKSFRDYLPALTMKYVHGIHRLLQKESPVRFLAILYPDDDGVYRDFHQGDFGVFGLHPASPSLICCGVILGENRKIDYLDRFVRRCLEIEGVIPNKF